MSLVPHSYRRQCTNDGNARRIGLERLMCAVVLLEDTERERES